MSFEEKYLKYKEKYLSLKNMTGGGAPGGSAPGAGAPSVDRFDAYYNAAGGRVNNLIPSSLLPRMSVPSAVPGAVPSSNSRRGEGNDRFNEYFTAAGGRVNNLIPSSLLPRNP